MNTRDFYGSAAWKQLRQKVLRACGFRCALCSCSVAAKGSSRVDHVVPVKQAPHLALEAGNLRVLCAGCDNRRHSEKGRGGVEKVEIGLDGLPPGWR